jgi:hypothetical protein
MTVNTGGVPRAGWAAARNPVVWRSYPQPVIWVRASWSLFPVFA